jgi:hypothetical protein
MSVNGITNTTNMTDLYGTYNTTSTKTAEKTENTKTDAASTGVVYESGASTDAAESGTKKIYKQDTALIAKLQADADARVAQLKSLVEQMITKQGKTLGQADSIWSFLASGDFTVNPEVKAQAEKDIAEDGYWGVEQTSDRIIDFATALTGGDPDKIEDMREAFKQGYEQATKTWGKELPELSKKTYEAVMEKFDKLVEESNKTVDAVAEDIQ